MSCAGGRSWSWRDDGVRAGNGRALIEPHVVSQPWLQEAGHALARDAAAACWPEAGVMEDAMELVFTASTTAWREASSRRTSEPLAHRHLIAWKCSWPTR